MEIRGYYDLENFVRLMLGNFVRECRISFNGEGEEEANFTYIMASENNSYSKFMKEVGEFARLSYTIGIEEVNFQSSNKGNTVEIKGYYY